MVEIIIFDQLTLDSIKQIIDIELLVLNSRVLDLGYKLKLEDKAKDFIATKGYDIQYGARPLKRAIQTYLEDGLSEIIVSATPNDGNVISITLDEESQELKMILEKES